MESTHATKERGSVPFTVSGRDEDQPLRNPEHQLMRLTRREPLSVTPVPLASSVIYVVTQSGYQARPGGNDA